MRESGSARIFLNENSEDAPASYKLKSNLVSIDNVCHASQESQLLVSYLRGIIYQYTRNAILRHCAHINNHILPLSSIECSFYEFC